MVRRNFMLDLASEGLVPRAISQSITTGLGPTDDGLESGNVCNDPHNLGLGRVGGMWRHRARRQSVRGSSPLAVRGCGWLFDGWSRFVVLLAWMEKPANNGGPELELRHRTCTFQEYWDGSVEGQGQGTRQVPQGLLAQQGPAASYLAGTSSKSMSQATCRG